ncbi:MAG: hypothetical protein EP147_17925 [Subdoligranulum sp.]|nr:hypothetical protein [Subdoligranulum sp.]
MDKPQSTQRRKARRRVMVLLVLCCAVFALFLARLAWLQFAMADHYAQKKAEASSASYTLPQHAARGAITDRSGTVLAQDETVYDVYLRVPAPPGTNLRETVNTIAALTGGKDVETQLAAFCSAVSAGELPVTQGLDSIGAAAYYRAGLVQSGAVRLARAYAAGRMAQFCPTRWVLRGRSPPNSGPLPGPRGWRWTRQ